MPPKVKTPIAGTKNSSASTGYEAHIGTEHADTFRNVPPQGNANFVWVQHFIHHLAPQTALRDSAFLQREAIPQVVSGAKDNMAGFVLANGSMSSNQSGERKVP